MSQSQCPDLDVVFIVMRTPVIIIIACLVYIASLSSGITAPLMTCCLAETVGMLVITLTSLIRSVTPAFLVPLCLWDNSQFVPDDLWAFTLTLSTLADWPSLAPPSARPPAAWGPSCPGTSSWPRVWPRVSAGARVWAGATCHDHSGDGMYCIRRGSSENCGDFSPVYPMLCAAAARVSAPLSLCNEYAASNYANFIYFIIFTFTESWGRPSERGAVTVRQLRLLRLYWERAWLSR